MSQPDVLAVAGVATVPVVERRTDLDMGVDQLWSLISTPDGWKSWLVDDADLVILPAATGTAVSDGRRRSVQIDSIEVGRAVVFSWWDRDDPSSSSSSVQLDLIALPGGRSQLHVTERFAGTTASAKVSSAARVSWEVRIISLWLMAVQSSVMA